VVVQVTSDTFFEVGHAVEDYGVVGDETKEVFDLVER
jgi:hypothetical protein